MHGRGLTKRVALGATMALMAIFAPTATNALGAGGSAERAMDCPGTFQVQHNDKIGKLSLPAGPYIISVKRMACSAASNSFRNFLQRPNGDLGPSWRLFARRAKFVNRGENIAFLVRPAAG